MSTVTAADLFVKMKKVIIIGVVVILLGLLIALGPQFIFKVCKHGEDGFPQCHWSAQAEIGMGILIAALGVCMIVFKDLKILTGLLIGTFLASFVALFIPHTLIGGCAAITMRCRRVAFPAITAESVILMVFSAVLLVYLEMKRYLQNNTETRPCSSTEAEG